MAFHMLIYTLNIIILTSTGYKIELARTTIFQRFFSITKDHIPRHRTVHGFKVTLRPVDFFQAALLTVLDVNFDCCDLSERHTS